jgi:hypothetical protein
VQKRLQRRTFLHLNAWAPQYRPSFPLQSEAHPGLSRIELLGSRDSRSS